MKTIKLFCFFFTLLLLACGTDSRKLGHDYLPPAERCPVFIDQASFPGYWSSDLPEPFGVAFHASLFQDVAVSLASDAKIRNLDSLLTQLNDAVPLILLRLTANQLKALPDGTHDRHIENWARTLKRYRRPVYMAVGFEVNNPIFELDPTVYVNGSRYFIRKLRSNGVKNVAYVWHVIAMKPRWAAAIPLDACYPGDEYINWLGLTVHNILPHHFPEDGFFEGPLYDEAAAFAEAHRLPIMICESSTRSVLKNSGLRGDSLWADWYEPFFAMTEKYHVRAISHILNTYDDEPIMNRWREEMQNARYIHGNADVDNELSKTYKR